MTVMMMVCGFEIERGFAVTHHCMHHCIWGAAHGVVCPIQRAPLERLAGGPCRIPFVDVGRTQWICIEERPDRQRVVRL